jgi:tetratricopeptide (TPR) repeat protein
MAGILTCPQGHEWETTDAGTAAGPATVACPVCGVLVERGTATENGAVTAPPVSGLPEELTAPMSPTGRPPGSRMLSGAAPVPEIPGYEILDRLGHGGMGVVYRARHLRLRRLVALKVILSGSHVSPQQRARFQIEAEALASLQHPNIVQVHEVGEAGGQPFLALELVEGGSLADALDNRPWAPDGRDGPRRAAALVETLARAVHTAHQRGIVHRDLKPGNVLLTPAGEPKITDFGLAKRLEEGVTQTQTGAVLGTPSYMAPEQAVGDSRAIGPPSDIYALGAILYVLLTGQPPFRGQSSLEILAQVREAEPEPPSRLQPTVPRDLEVICLKCLEKEPGRRYASAEALAEELHRFLAGEPITARPVGLPRRLLKWVKRRPAVAGLVAVSVLAAVALAGLGLWSNIHLRAAAQRAESRSRLARQVVDDMYTKVAQEWLAEEPHRDPLRKAFLEKTLELYQEFAREESGAPEVRREAALAWFRVGEIERALTHTDEAKTAYDQAIHLQEQLSGEFPGEPSYRQDLATSLTWRGELLRENGQALAAAEQDYQRALELQEALAGQSPGTPAYLLDQARSLYNLGIVAMDTGREEKAAQDYDRAIALLDSLHRDAPANVDYRHELARCTLNQGILLKEKGQLGPAEDAYRRAIRLLDGLTKEGRPRALYRFEMAVSRQNLGNVLWSEKKKEEARHELDEAAGLLRQLVTDFPARAGYRKKLANTYISLGSVEYGSGDRAASVRSWAEAATLLQKLVEEAPQLADYQRLLGTVQGNLALARLRDKDLPGACRLLQDAITHLRLALAPNPESPEIRQALRNQYQNLAEAQVRSGDHAGAVAAARELARVFPDRPQDSYYAACFIARAAGLAQQDQRLPDSRARRALAGKYAGEALALLRETARRGTHGLRRLPNEDEVFRPLRGNPELPEILAALRR